MRRILIFVVCLFASQAAAYAQSGEGIPLTRVQAQTGCDKLAADPYDSALPEGLPTVQAGLIDAKAALAACRAAVSFAEDEPRFRHQAARALLVSGEASRWREARALLQRASSDGYAASFRLLAEIELNPLSRIDAVKSEATVARANLAPPHHAEILKLLREAAKRGDILAKVLQGELLLGGELLLRDPLLAEAMFRNAAEAGSARGDLALGHIYAHGSSARRDYGQARAAYERAADKGEPDALIALGGMAEHGLGETVDPGKARRLYQKAADLGSLRGVFERGRLGNALPGAERKADFSLIERAASLGVPEAVIFLAETADPDHQGAAGSARELLRKMALVRDTDALIALGRIEEAANELSAADTLYQLADNLGAAQAAAARGDLLVRQGRDAEAEPILQRAAERGDDKAALRYAEVLIRQFRQQEAEGWFQLAAYANMPGARRALGTHYRDGTMGRRSVEAAKQWYRRALEGGDESARMGLAAVSLEAAAQSGNYDEARRMFQSIPEGVDFAEAQWQLGLMALNGLGQQVDPKQALIHFEASAKKGDTRAIGMVAALFEGEQLGPPNMAKAREWYIRAAELNDTSAMFRLAAIEAERVPDPASEEQAVRWLERASHLGMAEAKLALAAAHHHGIGTPRDGKMARKLLAELNEVGDFAGRLNFARALEIGIGGEPDPFEAQNRFRALFEEAGTPLAQLGLARLAEKGSPTQQADPSLALYLYAAVADTSNDEASAAVARLKLDKASPAFDETGALFEMRKGFSADLPLTLEMLVRHACPQAALEADCQAAVRRLDEMAGYGVLDARPALAALLEEGIGIAKDKARAEALRDQEAVALRRLFLTSQFILID